MAERQVTITLPMQYIEAAKRIAVSERTTVSGLAARALRQEILRRDLELLVKDGFAGEDSDWYATIEADRS